MTDLDTHQSNNRRIGKRHNENQREWSGGKEGAREIERSGNRNKREREREREREDERTGSKTVGAAFLVDEVSRN